MKRDGLQAIIRIKDMKRDVFGNGKTIDETLAGLQFNAAYLNTHRGVRKVEMRCAAGVMQYCGNEHSKNSMTEEIKLLVVESRFDGKSIYLYVICPDEIINNPPLVWKYVVHAAQSYCDRWQIETSFQTVKQEFKLEEARVRKFKRLTNLFVLCILAYVFMIRYLRESAHFKKIKKTLNDNFKTLTTKMHSLLAAIRELCHAEKIRCISGRPRNTTAWDKWQMMLELE